jgi:spore coat polysaccharide biosynthesis protein SpsF
MPPSSAPKVVAIIQARMGSTRLPGKVLADIGGETTLARVLRRLQRCKKITQLLVATTPAPLDDEIVEACRNYHVDIFRGQEADVLDRYYNAAKSAEAAIIVRITSDCPLIDPEVTDQTIAAFLQDWPDYASNNLQRTYPRGLDTEVISFAALERCWNNALRPYQRTHVTPYVYENPDKFRILRVTNPVDYSALRWTVDTPEDLAFVRAVYAQFQNQDNFAWKDILAMLKAHPQLSAINQHIEQKALYEG